MDRGSVTAVENALGGVTPIVSAACIPPGIPPVLAGLPSDGMPYVFASAIKAQHRVTEGDLRLPTE